MNNGMDPVVFRVDQCALVVKHAVARIGIRALLCVGQNLVGTLASLRPFGHSTPMRGAVPLLGR